MVIFHSFLYVTMENHRKSVGKWWLYPLVNIQKAMENHHAINGKINYVDWAIFNSYVNLYRRVYELQPKFRLMMLMESSIRAVSIFWKLSRGLENDHTLCKKKITFTYIPKPEKR